MSKTLSVNAIENGTVIDHIPPGQAIRIASLLKLAHHENQITIGLNLKSSSTPFKDLIKISGHQLNEQEQHYVSLLAPQATINLIENFTVVKKFKGELPDKIIGLLVCPNPNCITNYETIRTRFNLLQQGAQNKLYCDYCEKSFSRQDIKEYTI